VNESKRRLADIDTLRRNLVGTGWRKTGFATEVDLYYRTPDGKLGRVRTCGSFTQVGTEDGESHVMNVPFQVEALRKATSGWAAEHHARVEKTRYSYISDSFPGIRIDLDCIPGTGMFVKVRSEFDPHLIDQLEIKLGLDKLEPVEAPYRDLVAR
jgi:adenylate cyclase class IV